MRGAPTVGSVSAGRQNNFNLIRMIAATGVLVSHAYPISIGPETIQPLEAALDGITLGETCVLVFFAVSGFFIAKSFDRDGDWRRFLTARAHRLFPALAVVLCLTVVVAGAFLTTAEPAAFWSAAPSYLVRNLTLFSLDYALPGTFTGNPYGPAINGSLWTLFYEVVCYAGVFIAGIAGYLRRGPAFVAVLALLAALSILQHYLPLPVRAIHLINLGLPFALGTGMYLWRDSIVLSPILGAALGLAAFLANGSTAFPLVFSLALSYAVFLIGFWKWPPALTYNQFGDYSYGTYIFAFPIQQLVASAGIDDPARNIALAFPFTLACAIASWHIVEKPALARVRHRP